MKRLFLLLIIMTILPATLFARADWKGKVLDEKGEPVSYAGVILISKVDSTVIAGTTTDIDGQFNIVSDRKDVILLVSMLGYNDVYSSNASDHMAITLMPSSEFLDGATISAVMPKTKLTGEGLQTSVRGSVLENIGSANDVLARTPGLIKGQNGLEVIGKGSPVVYINGRRIIDSQELDRLVSSDIQSVEVITNPGAQYDASVKSVVRIKTIKRQGEGFGFNTTIADDQSLRRKSNNDPSFDFNANYRHKNVDVFGGANIFEFSSRQESDLYQKSLGKTSFEQKGDLENDLLQKGGSVNGGLNWQIADNHSVGFKSTYNRTHSMTQHQRMTVDVLKDGTLVDRIESIGDHKQGGHPYSFGTNAYYNGSVGKLSIDFNADYYTVKASNIAHTEEKSTMTSDATVDNESSSKNDLYATKLVLSYPIWKGSFQIGTEETFSRRSDDYTITGSFIPASSSKVNEDNIAGFVQYGVYLEKIGQISAGARYEHINYSYVDLLANGSFTKKYDNLFPSISYAGGFGQVQTMLSYSIKTRRPNFENLSDAIRYNNRYVLQSGNSALQPETTGALDLMAMYKFVTLMVNYSSTKNAIASWSSRYNEDGVVLVRPVNLDKPQRSLSSFVNLSPTIGFWNMNYTFGVQQQWLEFEANDPTTETGKRMLSFNDKPMFIAQLNNTLSFKKGWQAELGAEYHSKGYSQNMFIYNNYLDLTAAVQKAFLRDQSLIVRLEGSNLAGLASFNVKADFGSHHINQTNVMDTQRVSLSIRYKFNSAQSKYRGTGAGSEVRSRM